jgi:hypothetical protein
MLLISRMPRMGDLMRSGVIEKIGVAEGALLSPGSKLFDIRVDLSAAATQDCPPVFSFRVVSRERAWVRRLDATVGDVKEVGEILLLLSTEPAEPLDGPPARSLRVATAGIMNEPGWLASDPD